MRNSILIGAPAIIESINLVGHLEGWHFCAKTGLWRKAFDQINVISTELKAIVRDNLHANADFALDNYFAVDGQKHGGGGLQGDDPAGKDGIIVFDDTHTYYITTVTAVHPTDASGNYYRQWQGVLTNDFGSGAFVVASGTAMVIGVNLNAPGSFVYRYAASSIAADITMAANDILTVNWKITVG